ncbi:probable L-type lectin-domain containing receptor kinase S.5 isoform X1 [Triticum urartu]|nr:probable L-type lectin-domain containing receptor kinase S.5 isoform X1 [Triticum urartu]
MTMPNTNSMLNFSCIAYAAIVVLALGSRTCSCLQFTYPNFNAINMDDFTFSPGSTIADGALQITPSTGNMRHRSGRVVYARETLNLWNNKRMAPTSFRTDFLLNILPGQNGAGEGMAFVLTNNPSLPSNSSGQWLGICNDTTDGTNTDPVVAVEFDTRKSYEDDLDGNHVGIDINSIKSIRQYPLSNVSIILSSGSDVWVSIRYHGTSKLFQVFLVQHSIRGRYVYQGDIYIDLSKLLQDKIYLVFAGSTGNFTQLNQIKSWNFTMIDE